jgi:hypothetical protein
MIYYCAFADNATKCLLESCVIASQQFDDKCLRRYLSCLCAYLCASVPMIRLVIQRQEQRLLDAVCYSLECSCQIGTVPL